MFYHAQYYFDISIIKKIKISLNYVEVPSSINLSEQLFWNLPFCDVCTYIESYRKYVQIKLISFCLFYNICLTNIV